ncbi:MAG: glycosyl transferase [Lutibacter sp.]|nr:MAG: glycosyl transferase [Lutibacter sp.]
MNNKPLVSIIIPNYNHALYLKERLDSIFNQIFQDFEVILLDDCSTDASREILTKYAEKEKVSHCVFNEINSGNTFDQWNKGIALAKGTYIWIAESDDYCENNFLEKVLTPLLEDKEIVLSYCQSNRVNAKSKVTGSWLKQTQELDDTLFLSDFTLNGNEFIERFLIYKNVIPNASAVVFRRQSLEDLGSLERVSKFKYCGDWILYFNLIINNKISYVSESLNGFRYHSESVIATANKSENRIDIIDIELTTKDEFIKFLRSKNPLNLREILVNERATRKILKYEKALLLIRNNNKIKGFILLLSVLDVFKRKFNFGKKMRTKIANLFNFKRN